MKAWIVEDHEAMRIILNRLLRKNFPQISEIGESETAEHALEKIAPFDPCLVLVDISLPGMDGIELIRRLKPQRKDICFLVVTGHEPYLYEQAARKAGADAILSKHDEKLVEAIGEYVKRCREAGAP